MEAEVPGTVISPPKRSQFVLCKWPCIKCCSESPLTWANIPCARSPIIGSIWMPLWIQSSWSESFTPWAEASQRVLHCSKSRSLLFHLSSISRVVKKRQILLSDKYSYLKTFTWRVWDNTYYMHEYKTFIATSIFMPPQTSWFNSQQYLQSRFAFLCYC